ncbi:hypothetical protein P20652_1842 [Pseudoalteromonas sp. BSi20652]|nr:hypothetical protein P20652_1842 [Pseudoalteromonas sp. BSi20652]
MSFSPKKFYHQVHKGAALHKDVINNASKLRSAVTTPSLLLVFSVVKQYLNL